VYRITRPFTAKTSEVMYGSVFVNDVAENVPDGMLKNIATDRGWLIEPMDAKAAKVEAPVLDMNDPEAVKKAEEAVVKKAAAAKKRTRKKVTKKAATKPAPETPPTVVEE